MDGVPLTGKVSWMYSTIFVNPTTKLLNSFYLYATHQTGKAISYL